MCSPVQQQLISQHCCLHLPLQGCRPVGSGQEEDICEKFVREFCERYARKRALKANSESASSGVISDREEIGRKAAG